jgi:hypothetical protein
MKFNAHLLIMVGLTLLSMSILIEQCYSQITFSNDWYGGKKRSSNGLNGLDHLNNDHFLSNYFLIMLILIIMNSIYNKWKDFVARLTSNDENISNAYRQEIFRRLVHLGSEYQLKINLKSF